MAVLAGVALLSAGMLPGGSAEAATTPAASAATASASSIALVTTTPTITGTLAFGSTLTAMAGTWGPGYVALSYRWNRNGIQIVGAAAKTYKLITADLGAVISVSVKGVKTGYATSTVTSASTPPVAAAAFTSAARPVISGTVSVGATLTARPGARAPAATAYAYQWRSGGVAIPGATASRYVVGASDAGRTLSVSVTGSKVGFQARTTVSADTAGVPAITSTTPIVSGVAVYGETLTAVAGQWGPAGVSITYSWNRDGLPVAGATARTYLLGLPDLGRAISVTVLGTKTSFAPLTLSSESTTPVAAAQTIIGSIPRIDGQAMPGSTLTAVADPWSPAPVALAYQWSRGGTPITGATSSTYTLTDLDAQTDVTVTMTGSKMGNTNVTQTSLPVQIGDIGSGYDVVVILGQSNAQGAGLPFDPLLDGPVDGLDQLAGSGPDKGFVIPAADSLYSVTHWLTAAGGQRVGPGMEFGRQLLATESAGREVLLVPAAQTATSITGDSTYSWDPANTTARINLYSRALNQIDLALASNPNNRLVAIIWAQGEADAPLTTGEVYESKLLTIIDGLRARFSTVPFLIGGMVPEWLSTQPPAQPIENALRDVAGSRVDVAYVPGVTASYNSPTDVIHYNAAGARAMGGLYFEQFKQLLSSSLPD